MMAQNADQLPMDYASLVRSRKPSGAGREFPAWLESRRQNARERLQTVGFPTRADESWKFSKVEPVLAQLFSPADSESMALPDMREASLLASEESVRGFFCGDRFAGADRPAAHLADRNEIMPLSEAILKKPGLLEKYLLSKAGVEDNGLSCANDFLFRDGILIHVGKGMKAALPLYTMLAGGGYGQERPAYHPRVLVVLEEGAEATWVLDQRSADDKAYFSNSAVEIFLEPSAHLDWIQIRRENAQAFNLTEIRSCMGAGSRLTLTDYVRGGAWSHLRFNGVLSGDTAACELRHLSILDGDTVATKYIFMEHAASHCLSRQLDKNILSGRSISEFNSIVHVAKQTAGSDSGQSNRNLLLSPEARAWSRPQLKIEADDVKATHGSATGPLTDTELFYLQSRGLDRSVARSLLTFGFAEEVLEKVSVDKIHQNLTQDAQSQLDKMLRMLV
ncbi:MAG: hypothetical protein A2Z83_01475 [Omnitrophica bacterium GWA2_52_8]|nr:MAG: hypothetical protein A2Z83_01475 [Omnitrophica bacterium GWA2_52_8]